MKLLSLITLTATITLIGCSPSGFETEVLFVADDDYSAQSEFRQLTESGWEIKSSRRAFTTERSTDAVINAHKQFDQAFESGDKNLIQLALRNVDIATEKLKKSEKIPNLDRDHWGTEYTLQKPVYGPAKPRSSSQRLEGEIKRLEKKLGTYSLPSSTATPARTAARTQTVTLAVTMQVPTAYGSVTV